MSMLSQGNHFDRSSDMGHFSCPFECPSNARGKGLHPESGSPLPAHPPDRKVRAFAAGAPASSATTRATHPRPRSHRPGGPHPHGKENSWFPTPLEPASTLSRKYSHEEFRTSMDSAYRYIGLRSLAWDYSRSSQEGNFISADFSQAVNKSTAVNPAAARALSQAKSRTWGVWAVTSSPSSR